MSIKKACILLGTMLNICNPGTKETEAGYIIINNPVVGKIQDNFESIRSKRLSEEQREDESQNLKFVHVS